MEEKQLINKFMTEVHSGRGLGIYGIHDVVKALESGIADLVLVADDISLHQAGDQVQGLQEYPDNNCR